MDTLIDPRALAVVRAMLVLIVGVIAARAAGRLSRRLLASRLSPQSAMLSSRLTTYSVVVLAFLAAMNELGFDLKVLLGAAGILTVAIGFASQTSASNLISGLFLIAERPFVIGDVIRVGPTTGTVEAIDLLSVKLRTFDNLFVRVPNETLLKAEITNVSHYPVRRLDLPLGIAYKEDLERVRKLLIDVADANPVCLDEPRPLVIFLGFGESSLNLQFSVWALRERFMDLRSTIPEEIKRSFDEAGVEIPFPQRTISITQREAAQPVESDEDVGG